MWLSERRPCHFIGRVNAFKSCARLLQAESSGSEVSREKDCNFQLFVLANQGVSRIERSVKSKARCNEDPVYSVFSRMISVEFARLLHRYGEKMIDMRCQNVSDCME
jgi:hypothetical protein